MKCTAGEKKLQYAMDAWKVDHYDGQQLRKCTIVDSLIADTLQES